MGLPQELRLGDKERGGCHDPKDKKEAPHLLAGRLGGWSRPVKPFKGFLLREPRVPGGPFSLGSQFERDGESPFS